MLLFGVFWLEKGSLVSISWSLTSLNLSDPQLNDRFFPWPSSELDVLVPYSREPRQAQSRSLLKACSVSSLGTCNSRAWTGRAGEVIIIGSDELRLHGCHWPSWKVDPGTVNQLGGASGLCWGSCWKSVFVWLQLTQNTAGHLSFLFLLNRLKRCVFLCALVLLKTWRQAGSRSVVLIRLSCCLVPSVLFF